MNLFYLICPIGLEKALLKELTLKNLDGPIQNIKLEKGGVEIECPVEHGLSLNFHLKTVTRILMRLKERKCRDFPKLFNTISKIPWRDYLVQEAVDWRITSSNSRIINTAKARESCEKALKKYFQGAPLSKKVLETGSGRPAQKVYLRLENDNLTISLDTSGELLHIRGGRPDRGKASLRESYAACLLTLLLDGEKTGTLVDPMSGTGTFLYEAMDFYRPNTREDFPFFTWKVAKNVGRPEVMGDFLLAQNCIAMDTEPKSLKREGLEIHTHDIFKDLDPDLKTKLNGAVLICNPPYGKRVKIKGDRKAYFRSLLERIEKDIRPTKYGIIIPADVRLNFDEVYPFNNNGIKVYFGIKNLTV